MPDLPPASAESQESEFTRQIHEKYRNHFAHYYRLHQLAEWALVNYGAITKDAYHATLQLILPKALKSFDSIRRLCAIASCEDAAVILRSLLNLLAVTRWISLDPGNRAKKYLAWYWVQMYRDAGYFSSIVPPEIAVDIEHHYNRVKAQFEFQDKSGKTKMTKHWYPPEIHSILDNVQGSAVGKNSTRKPINRSRELSIPIA